MSKYVIERLSDRDATTQWDRFVDLSPQGSIFCRSWWLEAVCPGQYEFLVIRNQDRLLAGMPLTLKRAWYGRAVVMPELTQTLGILLPPPTGAGYQKTLSRDLELTDGLLEHIPSVGSYHVRFHYNFTNWLPFYWAGYQQTTRYTYVIEDLSDLDLVISRFAHSKRKNLKKAASMVKVATDLPPADFYAHHRQSLAKLGRRVEYSYRTFERICQAASEHQSGRIFYAVDDNRRIHSAIMIVYDAASAYYLVSSIDPDYRSSQSATLLLLEAMKYAAAHTSRFDFEGSMIRAVERSFRRFGAVQKPYYAITGCGKAVGILRAARGLLKALVRSQP